MENVPSKHTHFSLGIDLQFQAIRTTWTCEKNSDGQRVYFPSVNQNDKRRLVGVRNPDEIRSQFFKMRDGDEDSALDFLNSVGVWRTVNDMKGSMEEVADPRIRAMRFQGAFGHRYFNGRAIVVSVEYLDDVRRVWRGRCLNRAKLRAAFGRPSEQGDSFTLGSNTLPIHMEWRGRHPHAVIQPITGEELLTALAWRDIITEAPAKVCQNPKCGIEYTGRTKFCTLECERANTKRAYRNRIREAEKVVRANPEVSAAHMVRLLADAGLARNPDWVVKARSRLAPQPHSKSG